MNPIIIVLLLICLVLSLISVGCYIRSIRRKGRGVRGGSISTILGALFLV